MKTARKAILLAMCAVLLVVASVMGTLAYFTDMEAVTNTFTIGKIEMTMDEAPTNEYGTVVAGDRRDSNEYKLIPGHTYVKDPTIHMNTESEDSWVFVKVENGLGGENGIEAASGNGYQTIAEQIATNGWKALTGVDNVYYKPWTANDGADLAVFANFKVDGEKAVNGATGNIDNFATTKDDDGNITNNAFIKVTAYAVQMDGFKAAADTDAAKLDAALSAWNATFGKE